MMRRMIRMIIIIIIIITIMRMMIMIMMIIIMISILDIFRSVSLFENKLKAPYITQLYNTHPRPITTTII